MTEHSILLIGGPDSGKTNYLARLWEALRDRKGDLIAPRAPTDIAYVEEALAHLLQGSFAPRSDKGLEEAEYGFNIPVKLRETDEEATTEISVPDVSGELWKKAVESGELSPGWMDRLNAISGALLFVRIGSEETFAHLDWVTSARILRMSSVQVTDEEVKKVPTQVALCELLRFIEHILTKSGPRKIRPRVALLITAWDMLDQERAAAGPFTYIKHEFPLLAGRMSDVTAFEVRAFGVSVVGGDFVEPAFKKQFLQSELKDAGYIVQDTDGYVEKKSDITIPVGWVVRGIS